MSYFTSKYYILGLAYATFENHCTLVNSPDRRGRKRRKGLAEGGKA
jgi:hypothetical protein